MTSRALSFQSCLALAALATLVGCSDDPPGKPVDTAVDDAEVTDTIILPDVVVSEVDVIVDVPPEVARPGEFGAPCNANGDCDSGYCVDGPKGYVCTRTCDTTCPDGYDCKSVASGTDVVFLCVPRLREPCTPCTQNFQCQGGLCMTLDGEGRCVYECETQEECDEGFTCGETTQASGRFCQPNTKSCTCYAGEDGGLRSCSTPSDLGVCIGVATCLPETGWSECSATTPSVEICDGMDNDCNGVWDDNLPDAGMPCQNTVPGVGSCTGTNYCLGESGWLCVGPTPVIETCNGLDDNCDGVVDDPFVNAAHQYVSEEHCGGCGVACAGKIPNAIAFCAGAGATPRCEVASCEPGYYKAGPLTCLPVEDYSCVPCLTDGHCLTSGSQCLPLDGGNFCGRDCAEGNVFGTPAGECQAGYTCKAFPDEGAGVRQCVPTSNSCTCLPGNQGEQRPCAQSTDGGTCFGTETCSPATGWSLCSAQSPAPETCNSLDDNCNGVTDDVLGRFDACAITNSFGTCPGALDCRTGTALTCVGTTPAVETCNGRDDDCNGQTDNVQGALCPLQKGVCAGSRQQCGGSIGFIACNIGSYGLTYQVNELLCDGLDNDCDGKTDEVDQDGDGHRPIACGGDDCNDLDPSSYPGASELCGDRVDNDCNGLIDDRDFDQDGFISVQCGGDDCNDESNRAHPGATEVCGDLIDNDCDGSVDNKDSDGDGVIDFQCGGLDCNDGRADIRPGAIEICDGLDNNCNSLTDEKDADADGFLDIACGGNDCDDTRPLVNPEGVEVCGNQIDENCSGVLNDRDIDGDGFIAVGCTVNGVPGNDCDDYDPQTGPGLPEIWDAKDNNCDGTFDENVVPVGSVIVTEILANPAIVGDDVGEWFEVTNVTSYPINLRSWQIKDNGTDKFNVVESIILGAGEAVVFCKNGNPTLNGGINCYEWTGRMDLSNSSDEIILIGPGGIEINRATYTTAPTEGRSRSLMTSHYKGNENGTAGNWCITNASTPFLAGTVANYATPGTINPSDCTTTPPPGPALAVPNNGIGYGGEPIVIYGRGFVADQTTVVIGGTPCTNVNVSSSYVLTCTTGLHAQGATAIVVTVGAASGSLTGGYTYTNTGDGTFTAAALVNAAPYTIAAGLNGPIIVGSLAPGGLATCGALLKPWGYAGTDCLRAEVGFGPAASNPSTVPAWSWSPAIRLTAGATDTFGRSLVINAAGSYAYGFRFSADGITWKYTNRSNVIITP